MILSLYSLFLISVGLFGYWKTASLPSLISSLVFGGALLLLNLLSKRKLSLLVLLCLVLVFGYRFMCTGKTLPAFMGLLTLVTLYSVRRAPSANPQNV